MKKYLVLTAATVFVYVLSTSYSSGPANFAAMNCTGSYGSQNTCDGSNCHGPNNANMVIDITLKDVWGNEVTDATYFTNAFYRVYISGRASGTFPKFSYQFSASSQGATGGSFVPATGLHTAVVGPAVIVEPTNPRNTSSVGINNNYIDSFLWQSPPDGAGEWTLYATALLANDDASRFGDKANHYQRSFFPIPASVNALSSNIKTSVYPNPVKDQLSLKIADAENGNYSFVIFNTKGQILFNDKKHISTNSFSTSINTASWAAGTHMLEIMKDGKRRSLPILKL